MKNQVGGLWVERDVADLVDDQQRGPLQVQRAQQEQPEHETGVDQAENQAPADGPVAELVDAQERLGSVALGDR